MKRIPNRQAAFRFMQEWFDEFVLRTTFAPERPLTPQEVEERLRSLSDHLSPFNRAGSLNGPVRRRPAARGAAVRAPAAPALTVQHLNRFFRDLQNHGVAFMMGRDRMNMDLNALCIYVNSCRFDVSGAPGAVVVHVSTG